MEAYKTLYQDKKSMGKGGKSSDPFSEKRVVGKDPEPTKSSGKDPVKQLKYKTGKGVTKTLRKGHHHAGQE